MNTQDKSRVLLSLKDSLFICDQATNQSETEEIKVYISKNVGCGEYSSRMQ